MTGEQNLSLVRQIEEHREFLLMTLSQNPVLLARAEPRLRELLQPLPSPMQADAGRGRQPQASGLNAAPLTSSTTPAQ